MSEARRTWWVVGGVLGLALLLGFGWLALRGGWFADDEVTEVSVEAAEAAEAKLELLRSEGEEARLSPVELSSLLRFRTPAWAINGVEEPSVSFRGDTLVLSGTISTDRLPSHPELDRVRDFLPASSRVEIAGQVHPLDHGRAALEIEHVEFAGVPIPSRYFPQLLERIGRPEEPGLAPTALPLRLPEGVGSARVEGGYLVLSP